MTKQQRRRRDIKDARKMGIPKLQRLTHPYGEFADPIEHKTWEYWHLCQTYNSRPDSRDLTVGEAIFQLTVLIENLNPQRTLSSHLFNLHHVIVTHGQKPRRAKRHCTCDACHRLSTNSVTPDAYIANTNVVELFPHNLEQLLVGDSSNTPSASSTRVAGIGSNSKYHT